MSERTSEINFTIALDENHVPEKISWRASDGNEGGICDSAMISLWDRDEKNTLRIDLWTKDMMVDDMKVFFHQMILSMSDTLVRATGEEDMAKEMKEFGQHFAEKLGLINK